MIDRLSRYFGSEVEIKAHGIIYRGLLVGADEEYIYLKGETTWITLPMNVATAVRKKGEKESEWAQKQVEGAPERDKDNREEKRLYSPSDLEKLHEGKGESEWPDEDEPKEPEDE